MSQEKPLSDCPRCQGSGMRDVWVIDGWSVSDCWCLYRKLAEEQTPLGKEFAEILHENLWNMYVRS